LGAYHPYQKGDYSMPDIQSLIKKLQSDNPDKRYEACEELRVSQQPLSQDAIDALKNATRDVNPDVADAAQRALALHTQNNEEVKKQDKTSTENEGGFSLLLILACVAIGSIAIYSSLTIGKGVIVGGIIGGTIVGIMPYITQRFRIFRINSQAAITANLTIIIVSFLLSGYYLYQEAMTAHISSAEYGISTTVSIQFVSRLSFLFILIGLGSITGVIVSVTTRWVCQRWLRSQASWWVWTIAAILLIVVISLGLFCTELLFAQ
jgi:hypothetical protein